MDCMEAMKEIPDKYFELAIADPPYGRKEHGGKKRSGYVKQKNGSRIYVRHDTHAGSGSCCIAAHRMRHEWLGFEIDEYYFEKAQQRIRQEQAYMTVYDFI